MEQHLDRDKFSKGINEQRTQFMHGPNSPKNPKMFGNFKGFAG